jgi:hypothetical protein
LVDKLSITYAACPDATPGAEISALANVYRFILDRPTKRGRLLDKSGLDDAKEGRSENVSSARRIIPERS